MAEKPTEKLSEKPTQAAQAEKSDAPVEQTITSSSSKPTVHSGEESPRTAREPDFDDDVPETPNLAPERQPTPSQKKRVSFQEQEDTAPAPPPKPPRPADPRLQAEATLVEAFPSIDAKVVKAVLVASGGKVEPAFNALLSMSDPDFQDQTPAAPPRRAKTMSQVESDALYARQLAEHYNSSYDGYGSRSRGDPPISRQRGEETGLKPNELYDKEHSFIDDDLPIIKENLQKGFQETKNTINKWVKDIQRRIDGDDSDEPIPRPGGPQQVRRDFGPSQSSQLHGIRKSADATRRSSERDRYDADPQVLSDDFGHRLELKDETTPPAKPPRPLANPNLFKSSDSGQESGVTASAGSRSSSLINRQPSPATGAKSGKWQPLSSVEPKAEPEDHDPFSLGDSDEELDTKKDIKMTDKEIGVTKPAETSTKPATTTAEASKSTKAETDSKTQS